jgi:hypothetical protein
VVHRHKENRFLSEGNGGTLTVRSGLGLFRDDLASIEENRLA